MKTIIKLLIVIGLISLFISVANSGFSKQEIIECKNWQVYAEQFGGFYLLKWQAEMCDSYGIKVDAKII